VRGRGRLIAVPLLIIGTATTGQDHHGLDRSACRGRRAQARGAV